MPATVTRQAFALVDSSNQSLGSLALKTIYDPVARTMTIVGPDGPGRPWLTPDQSYKIVLLVPTEKRSDIGGVRAIDRATLYPNQKLEFVFRAGPSERQTTFEPTVDFCADVLPVFVAKCASSTCHGISESAASSLVLGSSQGVRVTAIGRIAQSSNVDARASSARATPSQFGGNMAIIEPGDPGSSWLTYKLELARPLGIDAGPKPDLRCNPPVSEPPVPPPATTFTPLAPASQDADDVERKILDDYVLGREMPYPYPASAYVPPPPTAANPSPTTYFYTPLDFQERERIRIWIARGAQIRECGACEVLATPVADAGAPASPAPDAGAIIDASDQ